MNKLLPALFCLTVMVTPANANGLTDMASKVKSTTVSVVRTVVVNPFKKLVQVTRSLTNTAFDTVESVTDKTNSLMD